MKKILLFTMLFILASCTNQDQANVDNKISSQLNSWEKIVTTIKESNENNVKIIKENVTNQKDDNKNISQNEVEKIYDQKLKAMMEYVSSQGTDYEKVEVLASVNCTWVCNLDFKEHLTKEELKIAKKCYKECIQKQEKAKQKYEKLKKEMKNEKKQYPKKCISDAEKEYKSFINEMKERKNQADMPWNFKIPSKEEFINFASEDCLVSYWYINRNCEAIKEYKNAYDKCKKVIEFEDNMFFVERWKWKTLDDFVLERRRFR